MTNPINVLLNTKFRNKLIFMCIVAIVPMILAGVFLLWNLSDTLKTNAENEIISSADSLKIRLRDSIETISNISERAIDNNDLRTLIHNNFVTPDEYYNFYMQASSISDIVDVYPQISEISYYIDKPGFVNYNDFHKVTEDIENLDLETYTNELIKLEYQYDRYTIPASVVNLVMVVLYFVVFQYYNKGRTLGKKLFKIKVIGKNKDLSINMLWIRALVNSSLAALFLLIVLTLVFLNINDYMTYYMIKMGISLVDTAIVITSAFMILYRKDKRGIQDLLASTEVVKEG